MVVDIKVALQADPRQLETMQKTRIFDTIAVGGAGGGGGGGAVQIVIFIEMIAGGEVETHGGSHSTHAQASEKTTRTPLVSTSLYFLHFNVCVCVCVWPLSVCTPQCVSSRTLLRVLSPALR